MEKPRRTTLLSRSRILFLVVVLISLIVLWSSQHIIHHAPPESSSLQTFTKFALFSSSPSMTYGFFTPLTSLLWIKMGFVPLVLMVGSSSEFETSAAAKIMAWSERAGAKLRFVHWDDPSHYHGIMAANGAQISRLAAGVVPGVDDDDYLLLADADMWPVKESYWKAIIKLTKAIDITNANDYGPFDVPLWERHRYPLSNIGARKRDWRIIMRFDGLNDSAVMSQFSKVAGQADNIIGAYMHHFLASSVVEKIRKSKKAFDIDELAATQLMKESPFWSKNVSFHKRAVQKDRLSKYSHDKKWTEMIRPGGSMYSYRDVLIDAHVGRGVNQKAQGGDWEVLKFVLRLAIPDSDVSSWSFINEYWEDVKDLV